MGKVADDWIVPPEQAADDWVVPEAELTLDPIEVTAKREVGPVEGGARGVGSTFAEQGNVLGLAGGGLATIGDAIRNWFTGRDETTAQDWYFGNVYDPIFKRAVDEYSIDPNTEKLTTGGTVANIGGRVAAMLPSLLASGGAAGGASTVPAGTAALTGAAVRAGLPSEGLKIAASSVLPYVARGAAVAQPGFAVPATVTRAQDLMENGVDNTKVAKASLSNWLFNTLMGAAPVSMAGNVATRAATGAGINLAVGIPQRSAEGLILGKENARLAQPSVGLKENGMDATLGAVMGALFGPRAGAIRPRARVEPTLDPNTIPYERTPVPSRELAIAPNDAAVTPGLDIEPFLRELQMERGAEAVRTEGEAGFADKQGQIDTAPNRPLPPISETVRADANDPAMIEQSIRSFMEQLHNEANAGIPQLNIGEPRREPGIPFVGDTGPARAPAGLLPDLTPPDMRDRQGRQEPSEPTMTVTRDNDVIPESQIGEAFAPRAPLGEAPIFGTKREVRPEQPVERTEPVRDEVPPKAEAAREDVRPDEELRDGGSMDEAARAPGVEVPADAVPAEAKAHDLTFDEWQRRHREHMVTKLGVDERIYDAEPPTRLEHGDFLETALESGEKLPPHVLADYKAHPVDSKEHPLLASALDGVYGTERLQAAQDQAAARADAQVAQPSPAVQTELPIVSRAQGTKARTDRMSEPRVASGGGRTTTVRGETAARAPKARSFLQELIRLGGVQSSQAIDSVGERGFRANSMRPGLFRRAGLPLDDIATYLHEHGWLPPDEYNGVDGGVERVREMLRDAIEGNPPVHPNDLDQVAHAARERYQNEWTAPSDAIADPSFDFGLLDTPVGEMPRLSADEQAAIDKEFGYESGPTEETGRPADQGDGQSDASGQSSRQGEDTAGRQNDKQANGDHAPDRGEPQRQGAPEQRSGVQSERSGGNAPDAARADAGDGANAERREPVLRDYSESELKAQDETIRKADEQAAAERTKADNKAKADSQLGDFKLSGSDRAADANSDQGTLYANPVGPMAKAVGKALGWFAGDSRQWGNSVASFIDSVRNVRGRPASPAGNPVIRFARAVFDSSSGAMRGMLAKFSSPTAQAIVDHFHTQAGSNRVTGENFSQAVKGWTNKQLTRLHNALGDFVTDKQAMKAIVAQVRDPQAIRTGTPIGRAAAEIRKILDEALVYMKEAGVDIGDVKNYFPREFDMAALMRDPQGFIDAAAQAYREGGASAAEAMASATALHDNMLYGETGSLFKPDKRNAAAPFLKERTFGEQVDKGSHPLNHFLIADPSLALPMYFQRAAKRAEIARRFGDRFHKWGSMMEKVRNEGAGELQEKLQDYVAMATGIRSQGTSNASVRLSSLARTWGSLMFLEKATLSSLTEFIVPAIRSGNLLDVGRSLKNTLADLVNKTQGAAERRALAEDLGIITAHLADTINAARFSGGDPVGLTEAKILDKYFRRTGLTQWTDATQVGAMDVGRVFIRRLASDHAAGSGKLIKRHLAELGVPPEQVDAFARFVNSTNDGMPLAGQITGPLGELYRNALRRFTHQSIMQPDKTLKPGWMAHPVGQLVGQLQSFNYAFYENVLKRNLRLAKEGFTGADYTASERAQLLMPTLMLPLLTAAAYAVGEGRDAILGDPNKRKEETTAQKVTKAISRGTPIAPIDPLLNFATSARYQTGAAKSAVGPVLGQAATGLDAVRDVLQHNSPNTNTAERQTAKFVYDTFIEPTVNLMLTATPVAPASAVLTQVAGSGAVREKFITAVAGAKKKKGAQAPVY